MGLYYRATKSTEEEVGVKGRGNKTLNVNTRDHRFLFCFVSNRQTTSA